MPAYCVLIIISILLLLGGGSIIASVRLEKQKNYSTVANSPVQKKKSIVQENVISDLLEDDFEFGTDIELD